MKLKYQLVSDDFSKYTNDLQKYTKVFRVIVLVLIKVFANGSERSWHDFPSGSKNTKSLKSDG